MLSQSLTCLIVLAAATVAVSGQTAPNCAGAAILAQGIALNIADQKQEQAALAQVNTVLQTNPVDMAQFATAKSNLLTFVNNGIAIRQANQIITPPGSKATMGIAVVSFTSWLCMDNHGGWN